ncbi:P-loop containing nucleoside triphosphate hydrolase protein [Decorospora gaudefroyi]|uniref:P-loop containing nucleoside triphosphate hydrolase protein n=1 Tax=Decorospora gaudefroyi TaxID=184978 RepID=A0A6A5K8F3_9PLEO|nr:P-loop containing nucleoside triphosphate hydrolase protein [Decorospora gaudefroyi]
MSGRGGRGGRGGGRGGGSNICFSFQKTGACNRDNCRFSHELNPNGAAPQHARKAVAPARAKETEEQQEARKSYSSWKRRLGETPTNATTMRRLWEGAFDILEAGDRDWRQQLPQDLDKDDDDSGHPHLLALLRTKVVNADYNTFISNARNFLLTLTHSSLLRCIALDTHIGSLYNLFGGVNGQRAILFLQRLCDALQAARADGAVLTSTADVEATLIAMSVALFELLKRERRARFNEEVLGLVDSIHAVSNAFIGGTSSNCVARISNRLDDVRALVARARDMLASDNQDVDSGDDDNTSFYPRDLVVPSGRYDNDKKDIAKMVLFPTRDEIMSDADEFLPYTDPNQSHFLEDPVQRHIDTYFRLLRHDIFGEMKSALAGVMHMAKEDITALSNPRINCGDMRTNQYSNARVSYVTFDTRRGLQAQVEFLQPGPIRKQIASVKEMWWEESRRFEEGSLISLIWVQDGEVQHIFLTVSQKITDPTKEYGLTHHSDMGFITASLVTQDRPTVKMLMTALTGMTPGILLEFPKVMPATFAPILESLKAMQRLNRLPFRQWIIPEKCTGPTRVRTTHKIPPALYARAHGFKYPLKTLVTKGEDESLWVDPTSSCDDEALLNNLEAKTQLDRGQCRALVAALTREFAFIQGPPGTGKSYLGLQIMRVLLDIKVKADLGPILIVCYTNHALDQFLEHLLAIGVKKLIRVGGFSKSKKLEHHNLRTVSETETKTKLEKYMAAIKYRVLKSKEKEAKSIFAGLQGLRKRAEWDNLKVHIRKEYPRIYAQFRRTDDQGFQTAGRHPFDVWRTITSPLCAPASAAALEQIVQKANGNVYFLSAQERGILISLWVKETQGNKIGELYQIVNDAEKTQRELTNIHEELNRRILEEADVIGVTTSGLAKRITLLQQVKCKVIICEEAGEVMEPHMLSAMLPDVEHLIQIGDHEQLRPSVSNFRDLSLESERGKLHQLDRSQFERLSMGEPGRPLMPVAQLNVQRRMRPQISSLIRETIYEKLKDHPSTTAFPDVVGMRRDVFWLDHKKFENQKDTDTQNTKSKSNLWEAKMVHALVRHIVRQGVYNPDDIAVLTPYTGQLQKLRATMRSDFEICLSDRDREALEKDGFAVDDDSTNQNLASDAQGYQSKPLEKKQLSELLRIATVDNFQGEEAKIIIVSLVRSNEKQNVGFLKTTNRINVLLSRAQHGMYLIGNADTYSSVEMWQKVISMLRATDSVGNALALCCPRHPETVIEIQQPDDFAKVSPEGGCREACANRLDCGHRCGARCHSEAMHAVFQCEQPCQRRHQACDHPCQKDTCGESCGKCMITMNDVQLPCGHTKNGVACHLTLDVSSIPCDVKISKLVPGCGHAVVVKCSSDITKGSFKCPTPCKTPLSCGHPCPGICGRCNTKDMYGQTVANHHWCTKKCGRKHGTCSHDCPRLCHDGTDCGLCQEPCAVRCKHNKCPQKCHEPCAPCVEPCVWSCEHQGDCTMPCSAPCNRLPCDERCTKLLPCGHQCPSICGEECPIDCCQHCGMKSGEQPDMIMMSRYADIDLDETPIVVLGCGHFFTTETLDGLIALKDVYSHDEKTGGFTGLIENTELATSVPQCPNCRWPIKQYVAQRYNRLLNRAVIDEISKRFIVNGQQELQQLEDRLNDVKGELEESRKSVIPESSVQVRGEEAPELTMQYINDGIRNRSEDAISLTNAVKSFRLRMDMQHQPTYKLHQATVHAISRSTALDVGLANLAIESSAKSANRDRDQRITLGGSLLEIKVRSLVIEDSFDIARAVKANGFVTSLPLKFPGGSPEKKTEQFLRDCKKLIQDCIDESLPRLAVEATLYYARIAQLFGSSGLAKDTDRTRATEYRNTAKRSLEKAEKLCENSFRGRDTLRQAITSAVKMLNKEFYAVVTKEEIEDIKQAMVSGPRGIATHSGHWYKCMNGHPFAIGECGMPMQLARCPECGAPVGGQGHTAVAGVSRATEMEN